MALDSLFDTAEQPSEMRRRGTAQRLDYLFGTAEGEADFQAPDSPSAFAEAGRTIYSIPGNIRRGALNAAGSVLQGGAELSDKLERNTGLFDYPDKPKVEDRFLYQAGKAIKDFAAEPTIDEKVLGRRNPEVKATAGTLENYATEEVPQAAGSTLTFAAGGAGGAGLLGASAFGALSNMGDAREEAKSLGLSEEQTREYTNVMGSLGTLEGFPLFEQAIRSTPGAKKLLSNLVARSVAFQAGEEAMQEGVSAFGQEITKRAMQEPDKTIRQVAEEAAKDPSVWKQAFTGLLVGGIGGGISGVSQAEAQAPPAQSEAPTALPTPEPAQEAVAPPETPAAPPIAAELPSPQDFSAANPEKAAEFRLRDSLSRRDFIEAGLPKATSKADRDAFLAGLKAEAATEPAPEYQPEAADDTLEAESITTDEEASPLDDLFYGDSREPFARAMEISEGGPRWVGGAEAESEIRSVMAHGLPGRVFGLRISTDSPSGPVRNEVGDSLPRSYVWDDGSPTNKKLPGTSAVLIRGEGDIARAIKNLRDEGYTGEQILLISGDLVGKGTDPGEAIIRNAKVERTWDKGRYQRPMDISVPDDQVQQVLGDLAEAGKNKKAAGQLEERVKKNAKNEPYRPAIDRTASLKRGKQALIDRIRLEERMGKLETDSAKRAEQFIELVPEHMLNDVAISFRKARGGQQGMFHFLERVAEIFPENEQTGSKNQPGHTIAHELWHAASRFVPRYKVDTIEAQYRRERDAYIKKNPWYAWFAERDELSPAEYDAFIQQHPGEAGKVKQQIQRGLDGKVTGRTYKPTYTADNYRFKNVDEWFVETAVDISFERLKRLDQNAKSLIAHFRNTLKAFWEALKAKFGKNKANQIINDMLDGVYHLSHNRPLRAEQLFDKWEKQSRFLEIGDTKEREDARKKLREGFRTGSDKHVESMEKREAAKKPTGWRKAFKQGLVDAHATIKDKAYDLKQAGKLEEESNPEYTLEELANQNAENESYLKRLSAAVIQPLKKAGIALEDFNEYLTHRRIINERSKIANEEGEAISNPQGFTKDTSQEAIGDLRREMGEEKFQQMEAIRQDFRKLREETILPRIQNSSLYDKSFADKFASTEDYATFDVVKYLDGKFGKGIGGNIYQQVGTLNDITAPLDATVMKDIAMMRAIALNEAKLDTADMMLEFFPDEIEKAETAGPGDFKAAPPGKELLVFKRYNKVEGYYVDKAVTDGFKKDASRAFEISAKMARALGGAFRGVFVVHNPGFWPFNAVKDFRRAIRNTPGARLLSRNSFAKYYAKALAPAFKSEFGIPPDVVKQMLDEKILISVADTSSLDATDWAVENLLAQHGIGEDGKLRSSITRPFIKMWTALHKVGAAIERVPKIAGYNYLTEQRPDIGPRERASIVRNRIGSPNFNTRGEWTPILNNLLLFSNAAIQGWRGDYRAFSENKADYTKKLIAYTIVPKALQWSLASGALLALIKSMGAPDDDEVVKTLEDYKKMYDNIPDYDMTNYLCIPLGMDENGKTVYLRAPQDEIGRFIGGVFHKAMNLPQSGFSGGKFQQTFSYAADQAPGLNPALMVANNVRMYLTGNNPYDFFRGEKILPDDVFEAGGWDAHKAMLKDSLNRLGASVIYRFPTGDLSDVRTELEKALGAPLVPNTLGRWLKVSDKGKAEKLAEVSGEEQQAEAKQRLRVREAAVKQVKGEELSPEDEEALAANERSTERQLQGATARIKGDKYARALYYARSRGEKDALTLQMAEDGVRIAPYVENEIATIAGTLAREIPKKSAERREWLAERDAALKWLKDRGVTASEVRAAYKPVIGKLKTAEGRAEREKRLRAQLGRL